MKLIHLDTETGGPDPNTCALLQLSAAIEIDWKIVEKINYYIKPYPTDPLITKEATEKHGHTNESIMTDNRFMSPDTAFEKFKEFLGKYVDPYNKTDKFIMVGYNIISFDDVVLRKFFGKNNDNYYGSWFWFPPIDVMAICADIFLSKRSTLPNFRLDTIAKYMGVEVNEKELHDAMYDVKITREIYIRHLRNKNMIYNGYQKYMEMQRGQEQS